MHKAIRHTHLLSPANSRLPDGPTVEKSFKAIDAERAYMNNVSVMALEDLDAVLDQEAVTKVRMSVFAYDYLYRTEWREPFKVFGPMVLRMSGLRQAEIKA
eukprot:comp23383_c4_seq2/m.38714 comp23383_c4_seq2/g.38714  ORF comp23383_c4_seq2/g.38714 comp23383_c4_seq2/m.38714 type:complete len:101 (-) comp23383_c4_seq2:124-426(-)